MFHSGCYKFRANAVQGIKMEIKCVEDLIKSEKKRLYTMHVYVIVNIAVSFLHSFWNRFANLTIIENQKRFLLVHAYAPFDSAYINLKI